MPLISLPSTQDPDSSIHGAPSYLSALKMTCLYLMALLCTEHKGCDGAMLLHHCLKM